MGDIIRNVQQKSVKNLLSELYRIPDYQRPFSWDKQEFTDLWFDLTEAIKEETDQYFLGSMVFHEQKRSDRLEVVDGHQRLATIAIILATLRDEFQKRNEKYSAEQISNYIVKKKIGGDENLILDIQQGDDQSSYLTNLLLNTISKYERKSSGKGRPPKNRPQIAHLFFKEQIQKKDTDWLKEFSDFLLDKVVIVSIIVSADEDPFTIFEVLNARGIELTVADLVKNKLLSKAGSKRDEMWRIWSEIETIFKEYDIDFSRFLRHFWLSKYDVITKAALYNVVRDHIDNQKDPFPFVNDLLTESKNYRELLYPSSDDPNASELTDLRDMKLMQHLPLLLAAKKLPAKQFKQLVKLCSTITVRYLIVGERNPNQLERKYSEWAKIIRKKKSKSERIISRITLEAKEMCPDDEEFEEGFKLLGQEELRTNVAWYILRKLEEKTKGEIQIKRDVVELEHIMPRNPEPGSWPNYDDKLVTRLGNLTLIGDEFNKQASNYSFEKKKRYYKKSEIAITKNLSKIKYWTSEEIEKRQNNFAKVAPNIWNFMI
jgi:uncharacterized protein with ParB-like and HNH nuclease domain